MELLSSDLRMALDPATFARSLGFEPDPWQKKTLRWLGNRLLMNCARQAGKSTIAAQMAVHRAIYIPDSLILLVSPSLRQSGELFRKVTDWFRLLPNHPEMLENNKLSCKLINNSRIISLPSTESTVRGFSNASLIIEDEASRVPDSLYRAMRPMLATSGGRLILLSTPFGKRGHFWQEWDSGGSIWERVEIPATENPRISSEFLEEEQKSLGDWWYRQEYLCEFVEAVDQVFSYDYVMSAVSADVEPLFGV